MESAYELNTELTKSINRLQEKQKREVLQFIEYLEMKDNSSFIEYVNQRTAQASEARAKGGHFTSLAELQSEYA